MEHSIAIVRREAKEQTYEAEPLIARIRELLEKTHHTSRAAALGATLDHQAINRILAGQRPNMIACILLADYFGLNPNENLQLAAWPKLEVFDIRVDNAANQSIEAVEVAMDIAKISNPVLQMKMGSNVWNKQM